MAHGTLDFGNVYPRSSTYKLDDMGELAERTGAVPSIDRLGDTIFIDSFEDGLCKWNKTETGIGTAITLSGKWSMHGGFSIKTYLPADGAAQAILQKSLPFPTQSMIGVEFNSTYSANCTSFIGYLDFYTLVNRIRYGVKYDAANSNIYVWVYPGAWLLIFSGVYLSYAAGIFHRSKFVVDLPNLTYKKFIVPTGVIDLSVLTPQISIDTTTIHMSLSFIADGNAGGIIETYTDSIIVTQNEP